MSEEDLENGIREYAERLKRRPLTEGVAAAPVGPYPIACYPPPFLEFHPEVIVDEELLRESMVRFLDGGQLNLTQFGMEFIPPSEPEADEPTIREGSS